jgi:acyl carrier protein
LLDSRSAGRFSPLEAADSVYPTDLPRRVPAATGTEEASFVRLDEYEPWVEPRVRRVVADSLGVTLEDLTAEVSLADDLAADSLDVLELALVLEEEFGFPLPERVLSDVRSYGDLVSATVMLARERRAAEARGSRALAFFWARTTAADGRGALERSGWLTPYVLEEIAEDARRAGCVWLEVAPRGDGPGLGAVWEECARLAARGISVNFCLVDEAAFRWRGATERAA